MQLIKALYAFYQTLFSAECEHNQLKAVPGQANKAGYCPDCGYKVLLMWTLCRCRTCGTKRHPRQGLDGRVAPIYRYCQQCGQADYQVIKRDKINVHEIPYALLTKEVDYSEERLTNPKKAYNPFELQRGLNIVEGEVLSAQYVSRGGRI